MAGAIGNGAVRRSPSPRGPRASFVELHIPVWTRDARDTRRQPVVVPVLNICVAKVPDAEARTVCAVTMPLFGCVRAAWRRLCRCRATDPLLNDRRREATIPIEPAAPRVFHFPRLLPRCHLEDDFGASAQGNTGNRMERAARRGRKSCRADETGQHDGALRQRE